MKRKLIFLLLTLVLVVTITGCGALPVPGDDDLDPPITNELKGLLRFVSQTSYYEDGADEYGEFPYEEDFGMVQPYLHIKNNTIQVYLYMIFSEENEVAYVGAKFSYTINGNKINLVNIDEPEIEFSGTFSISGNTVILVMDGDLAFGDPEDGYDPISTELELIKVDESIMEDWEYFDD